MTTQSTRDVHTDSQLGLRSLLLGSLPDTLLTADAPDRYTVEAVFTRRPEREEIAEILGGDTRRFLSHAGFPAVEVAVSDRRLEIANTNLEELRDGLGRALGARLAEISDAARLQRDDAAERNVNAATVERHRTEQVAALASSVTF